MSASIIVRPPRARDFEGGCMCCTEAAHMVLEFYSPNMRFLLRLCELHFVDLEDAMKGMGT